ncbi:hypothetical protein MRX96_022235 [Rhipicephalus microplus]
MQAHQRYYGIATTANQPDTLDVNKPSTDKSARLLHKHAVDLKRRSRRRRQTRKSLDSNQDVDDMAALRATDISVASGESCPLDRGSSASISLRIGGWCGDVTNRHSPHCSSRLRPLRATEGSVRETALCSYSEDRRTKVSFTDVGQDDVEQDSAFRFVQGDRAQHRRCRCWSRGKERDGLGKRGSRGSFESQEIARHIREGQRSSEAPLATLPEKAATYKQQRPQC